MNLETLKSSEIPGGIRVLIADDDAQEGTLTNQAWSSVLQEGSTLPTSEVLTATNGNDLMAKALGLLGSAVDVVVLDHRYRSNFSDWKPTEDMLSIIAQKRGVSFEPVKKPDRGHYTVFGEMPDDLYNPNSVHFALLLRYLKFSGKIIVVSNGPPDPEYIDRETNSLNEHLMKFDTKVDSVLIDGVLTKPSRYDECSYATTTDKYGWDYKKIKITDFSEAIKALVAAL